MSTLEEVRKAYADLSDEDKETFHQSIADRVHESIAAQERDDGDEDTQTAEDREHEALGAEHADERREEEKDDEQDARQEAHEEGDDGKFKEIFARLDKIDAAVGELMKSKDPLEEKREKYGMASRPVAEEPEKKYTEADVDRLLGK